MRSQKKSGKHWRPCARREPRPRRSYCCGLRLRGPRVALGFLIGAALSFVNLRALTIVVNALGGSIAPSLRASVGFLALRYLIFGGVTYVIVKVLNITPAAVLAGLLVTFAAVMLEALYEFIYART